MSERIVQSSPSLQARVAGALWLTCMVTGIIGFVAGSALLARHDAAAIAANVLANESRFRLGFAADLISALSYLGVTGLLYHLLKRAGRSLSFVAACFGLAGIAIGGVGTVAHLTAIVLLHGDPHLSAFTTSQLQAIAAIALNLRWHVFTIGMVFFGVQVFIAGRLILRSP